MRKGTVKVNCVNKRGGLNVASFLTLCCVSESNIQRTVKWRKQNEEREKIFNKLLRKMAIYLLLCSLASWMRN